VFDRDPKTSGDAMKGILPSDSIHEDVLDRRPGDALQDLSDPRTHVPGNPQDVRHTGRNVFPP
jgi:hypothetical protein